MDYLLKQTRSKYRPRPAPHTTEEPGYTPRTYLAPKKSQSSTSGKNSAGNWLGRQFSRQMNRGNEFSEDGIERVTAVAAAAYAIHSVKESEIARPRKRVDFPPETSSLRKTKDVDMEDNLTHTPPPRPAPKPSTVSPPLSDFVRDPGEEGSNRMVAVSSEQQKQSPIEKGISGDGKIETEKPVAAVQGISGDGKIETEKPVAAVPIPRPPTPPISRKPSSTAPTHITEPGPIQTRPSETKADLWEKAEMAKIKDRYQKVNETISYWETKKRDKARLKYEASQAVGNKRSKKERGRKGYQEDLEFIRQIAGEARAKADQKRKNDILKANQKADIIRKTGDLPVTCFCC